MWTLSPLRKDRSRSTMVRNTQVRRGNNNRSKKSTLNIIQPKPQRTVGTVFTREQARMQVDPIRNGIRVRNREILQSVVRTTNAAGAVPSGTDSFAWRFNNAQIAPPASPGAGTLGPYLWLGGIAQLYDKYRIMKLKFSFVPSLPFTASGQAAMFWDSDPRPVAPTLFQQISGNVYAKSVQISQPLELTVRPNQVNRLPQYQTSVSDAADSDTGTVGWLQFINQPGIMPGVAAASQLALGTIWMEYEIEFLNPGNPALGQPAAVAVATKS
nr:MAG: putative capsid protein [Tombusviridae sp.]